MTELSPRERHRIAPLFDHTEETMVRSCLDGMMGRAWADRADTPACAQIVTADFCFFAGDASAPGASALVRNIPPRIPNDLLIFAAPDEGWERLIGDAYPDAARGERYALKQEPDCFDRARLLAYAQGLGPEYALVPIGPALYHALSHAAWSRDLVASFAGARDYAARGIGYAVLYRGVPVCGASSYTVYRGGIEIEIDTRGDFRRRGLALACGAKLILACLARGLYPSWDAASRASLALAGRLGYRFSHAYPVWFVRRG